MATDLEKLLAAVAEDEALRKQLAADPDKVFAKYPAVTKEQRESLKKLAAPPEPSSPWPKTFKDVGAAVLSLLTVLFFAWAVWILVSAINTGPVFTLIPQSNPPQNVSFEPFERAQVLFNSMLPLFGGLFAYWLGVQIEGKRADAAEKKADQATSNADSAQKGKEALLASATPDVLREAQDKYPALFSGQTR